MIELRGVSMVYRMGEVSVPVLRDVSLRIESGEFVVVLGPSGSGKSTLLNLIGGIDRPTSGEVLVDGVDLAALDDAALTEFRREHVGFVFQFYNLVPTLTAVENVAVAAELVAEPLDPDDALDLVGLSERREHFPAQLSGGEQQRVGLARALAKNPSLLLCDEPTGALDLEIGREVLGLLSEAQRRLAATLLLVTHNSAIADMAGQVIHIGSGRIERIEVNEQPVAAGQVVW